MAGVEKPLQLWRVKQHADGSVAAARISFLIGLNRGRSFRLELQSGKPASSQSPLIAKTDGEFTTLDNGIVALRVPKAGEMKFDPPLANVFLVKAEVEYTANRLGRAMP